SARARRLHRRRRCAGRNRRRSPRRGCGRARTRLPLTTAVLMAIYFTYGFSVEPDAVGQAIGVLGEGRTLGYAEHGAAGMLTLFVRGVLCNWMVSTGVVGAMMSDSLPGK